jgi:hypothetical protein
MKRFSKKPVIKFFGPGVEKNMLFDIFSMANGY